jgi:hypothetical protein
MKWGKLDHWYYRWFSFFSQWRYWNHTSNKHFTLLEISFYAGYPQLVIGLFNFSLTIFFYDRRKSKYLPLASEWVEKKKEI